MARNLQQLLQTIIRPADPLQAHLLEHWHHIMGPLSERVTIEKVSGNQLVLGVFDSCWLQELHALSPVIIATINNSNSPTIIKSIRFKLVPRVTPKKPAQHTVKTVKTIRLLAQEEERLSQISNQELRDALKQFLIRCKMSTQ